MKKTFCSILAGMVVVGSAFADAPTIEDRRALCEKHPDKYVWVEKTEACVPINPCESDNAEIKSAYCDAVTFSSIHLPVLSACSVVQVQEQVRGNIGGIDMGCRSLSGQYIVSQDKNIGSYMVYKFADVDLNRSSATEYLKAYCFAWGGREEGNVYYNDNGFASIDCKTPVDYDVLKNRATFKFEYNKKSDGVVTISYKSEQACYGTDDCYSK